MFIDEGAGRAATVAAPVEAATAALAAALRPSGSPCLRRLVLRCPTAAAVRQADELLATAGPRLRELELAVRWPHALPHHGLSYCTALLGLRVLCPCDGVHRSGVSSGGFGGGALQAVTDLPELQTNGGETSRLVVRGMPPPPPPASRPPNRASTHAGKCWDPSRWRLCGGPEGLKFVNCDTWNPWDVGAG